MSPSGTGRRPSSLATMRWWIACVMTLGVVAGCDQTAGAKRDPAEDRAAIETALRQWPNDFNAEDLPGVCGLFAENVVLAYPGGGNRGWNAVCDRMRGLFDDPAKKFTVSDATDKPLETTRENGVDVFRRQRTAIGKSVSRMRFPTPKGGTAPPRPGTRIRAVRRRPATCVATASEFPREWRPCSAATDGQCTVDRLRRR